MLAVLVGGVCPGANILLEELSRNGLDLVELSEQVCNLSLDSREFRTTKSRINEVLYSSDVKRVLIVGNDNFLKLAYSLCSASFQVAYVPSADTTTTCQGLGTVTVTNYLVQLISLARRAGNHKTIRLSLPVSLKSSLTGLNLLLRLIEEEQDLFLMIPGDQSRESTIKLKNFLNCLDVEEYDRECAKTLVYELLRAFSNWPRVHHMFRCHGEPIPISQVYELWKKVGHG